MEQKSRFVDGLVVGAFLMLVVQLGISTYEGGKEGRAVERDTVRVEVTDTIRCYVPEVRDSVVLRYVSRVLPVSSRENSEARDTEMVAIASQHTGHGDSVAVEIPITQKKYETDQYRAYVSGFEPSLDSIFVYQKTVTESVVVTQQAKQQRFGVGVVGGFGYGVTSRKPDVFVGLGMYWRL